MGSSSVTLDFSKAMPITPADPEQVNTLKQSVSFGVTQDPDRYAQQLKLQQQTGLAPEIQQSSEDIIREAAQTGSIDYHRMVSQAPRTSNWASNPDNAAVSGVDEIQRMARIEQSAATMRAYTPTFMDSLKDKTSQLTKTLTGSTPQELKNSLYYYPLTRTAIDAVSGAAGLVGNIGSFVGIHGDKPDKQNLLQRLDVALRPESQLDSASPFAKENGLDTIARQIGPMLPAVLATGGTGLLAQTLKLSEPAARLLAGLGVGAMFTADQAGQTYTELAGSGASDYDARIRANRVAAIMALPNALFGAQDAVPFLRENPLLTTVGVGGVTGAAGQAASNSAAGKRWNEGIGLGALQGAAMQGGMHLGMEGFFGSALADAVAETEASTLRQRSPEKFAEVQQAIHDGAPSLQIPVEDFASYFRDKGLDPQQVAADIGANNYPEAVLSGGNLEVAPADFLSRLDPEHQKALLQDVVDPSTGLSSRQTQQAREEIETWMNEGGPSKLAEEFAAADAETQASPEYQELKTGLRQQYLDAGETETAAESQATLDAHVYSNLARQSGLTPAELLRMYPRNIRVADETEIRDAGPSDAQILKQSAVFGPEHEEFYHDAQGAVAKLLADKTGVAVSAVHHPEVGDIDLVYGKEGSPKKNYKDGYGIAKLSIKHPEVIRDLQGFLDRLHVIQKGENRIRLGDESGRAVVRLSRDGKNKPWLLTAFELDGTLSAAADRRTGVASHAEPAPNPAGQEAANADSSVALDADRVNPGEPLYQSGPGEDEPPVPKGMTRLYHGSVSGETEGRAWFSSDRQYAENYRRGAQLQYVDYPTERLGEQIEEGRTFLGELDSDETGPRIPLKEAGPPRAAVETKSPVRGWFRVLPDGSFEIVKTKSGDLSTFLHETAHSYLQMLSELSKREGASDTLKQDYDTILKFLRAKDGEPLTRAQQELWARANEMYLREGRSPTRALRDVFQRFTAWLGNIYRHARQLGVELDPEIRGVFDRLYAGEESVNRAEQEAGPALFTDAEQAGWTQEEFQKYAEAKGVAVDQAKAEVLGKLNEAAERERTESWREEKRNVTQALTEQIDARQDYVAIRSLRRGRLDDGTELTLNREDLVSQFGEDRVKALQKAHPGLYRAEGGVDPETAAEIFGYRSGEEMLRALESAPRRSAAIRQAVMDYMTNKYGDIRYDGTLDDASRLAVENHARAENLYRELTALKKKLAGMERDARKAANVRAAMESIAIAPLESYQDAARAMIDQKAIVDLQPTRYLNASRKYSREAFDAVRKGNVKRAADAKHKELLNHFLFREASEARDYVEKFEKYVTQAVQSKGIQQRMGLAGSDYRDQFNWLLARYQLGPGMKAPERSLRAWADDVYGQGKEPAIAPSILDDGRFKNYRNVSLAEVRDLYDALKNIQALARQEFKMFVHGKQVAFAEAKAAMIEAARTNLKSRPERIFERNATAREKMAKFAEQCDATLMRTERLIEWLDGGKQGPWHDNLWNLAADSQGVEYALQHQVTRAVGDAIENMPASMRRRLWEEKVTVAGIPEPITRHDLVSMAFNMGNEGNLDRLRKTFVAHGWDPEAIRTVGGMLTHEEWKFVQDSWNMLKPLGERMTELEKRLTGLPPVMVKVTPFKVALTDGTEMELEGGYYPIKMDPRFSDRAIAQDAGESAQNAMQSGYVRATTSRGYTKERTGFGGPLLLDFEQVLTDHTTKVIKDLTHREFMLAANRLLLDTEVRNALRETLGPAYEEQFMPWLRTIINDRNGSVAQGLSTFSRLVRGLRSNLTLATLSFKVTTSLLQWTHAPRMLLMTRPAAYAEALVAFLAHPVAMTREIRELSPNEMRFRGEDLDRDIREKLQDLGGKKSLTLQVARAGNLSIQFTDHLLSFPLWLSVYRDTLKEHVDLPEAEARYKAAHAADSAIRLGLGSAAPKDLPPIMRNNDLAKLLTMFYSFHNGIYNQIRDVGHEFRYDRNVGKLTYGMALSVLAPAVLSQLILGERPKDGENPVLWAIWRSLLFGADTIPLLRDVASMVDRHQGVHFSPLESVLEKGGKALVDAGADKEDKDWPGIGLNALETVMDLAGVPGTAQTIKPLRYMNRVHKGEVENPNVWDALVGSGSSSKK
ncbi:MAG TPA: hypothetical protein VHB45_12900 [Alloacidobacterium sp.]|nr:hypothetical protein [Alloacidobacterium sp.]